jgi:hypothetical protein
MTEADWLAAKDLWGMVIYISDEASYRKQKLMTCALHRRVAPGLPAPSYPEQPEPMWIITREPGKPTIYHSKPGGRTLLRWIFGTATEVEGAEERLEQFIPPLARCVFRNPFRPLKVDPACLTPAVRDLARAAYDEAASELDAGRLAVLADAIEGAGGPTELVQHLREPGLHVCGCWAVDACLGLG